MQVQTTNDYSKFKIIGGNRNIMPTHVSRLVKSMSEVYLFTVITVNRRHEIIDGQHRFEAIKQLGLPLNYVVCPDYGLNEVQIFNQCSRNWTSQDFIDGYIDLGNKNYQVLKDFITKYGFGSKESISILSGSYSSIGGNHMHKFRSGEFQIKDLKKSLIFADRISSLGEFYIGYKRRSFVAAMVTMMNNKNFDFDEFYRKLKLQPKSLVDCTTTTNYIDLIEDIYNFKRKDKVNLRF
jgi:hypothetical protein